MPGPGVQHAKTGNQVCHCHCEAETLPSPAYNKDISLKKQLICLSRKDEGLSNKSMIEHNGGIAMPLPDSVSHGVANKWPLNHWWEAPTGFGSRGRAASSMLSMQDQLDSPTHSDITFEGGTVSNLHRDDASETAPVSSATFSKTSISGAAERVCDSSNEQGLNTSISSRMGSPTSVRGSSAEVESFMIHHEAGHPKERTSQWTDEDGKMVIQSNVFDAILPSADEVGLQWRISELRVALRASESARLESELETEALRKYLAEVEAAAAGLQSRVQELEHLITFSAKDESRELEQLRAKIVMEVSKEARSQTTRAAKAVAAAREATMELDKVKRHASSLIKAQEEEAERLRMEAAECRTLYHARAGQLQGMKDQIEKLEQKLKISSNATTEALKVSQEEVFALQKCLEAAKIEGQDITKQFTDLLEAFETQTKAIQSAENHLKELEREKTELASHSEWLEQQLADLQSQGVAAAAAVDYDHELRKVRAMLGAEKQHLLTELTMLRHGNQNLQVELIEWQEKFHTLSQQVSAPMALPTHTKGMDSMSIRGPLVELQSKGESHQEGLDNCENAKCTMEGKGVDGQECMTPTMKDTMRPSYLYSCQKSRTKHNANSFDGHYNSSHSKEVGRKVCGLQEQRARGNTHQTSCNLLKDDLLAAAHREIVKLKEINQCLMDARHGKMWYGNSHPEKENFSQI